MGILSRGLAVALVFATFPLVAVGTYKFIAFGWHHAWPWFLATLISWLLGKADLDRYRIEQLESELVSLKRRIG
jgi:hypothetical protein